MSNTNGWTPVNEEYEKALRLGWTPVRESNAATNPYAAFGGGILPSAPSPTSDPYAEFGGGVIGASQPAGVVTPQATEWDANGNPVVWKNAAQPTEWDANGNPVNSSANAPGGDPGHISDTEPKTERV